MTLLDKLLHQTTLPIGSDNDLRTTGIPVSEQGPEVGYPFYIGLQVVKGSLHLQRLLLVVADGGLLESE